MLNYVLVSIAGGVLFGAMDTLLNANPLAQRLYEVFRPIARTSVNAAAGIFIDLIYGFALAGVFLLLYKSLPGASGWTKGLSFGVLAWFFRVLMAAVSQWMMFDVPARTVLYTLGAGLVEMLVLGLLYALALRAGA
jgi:hypothetical protein